MVSGPNVLKPVGVMVRVAASSKGNAMAKAKSHYQGYGAKIHSIKHLGMEKTLPPEVHAEEVEQTDEAMSSGWMLRKHPDLAKKLKDVKKNSMHSLMKKYGGKTGEEIAKMRKEDVELEEGIEDKIEAARERAKAAGKPVSEPKKPTSTKRAVSGSRYGGSKQKDEMDEEAKKEPSNNIPFEGPYVKKPDAHGPVSRVRHLARMAMQNAAKKSLANKK